ncbi:MAG: hypothetical protein E6357_26335 [Clostridiales bacterium]|nr:hypothetical protein [Clostridiales bacterium]
MSRLIDGDVLLREIVAATSMGISNVGIKYVEETIKKQPQIIDKKELFKKIIEKSFVDYDEYYSNGGECLITLSDLFDIFKLKC